MKLLVTFSRPYAVISVFLIMCLKFRSHLLQNLSDVSKHIIILITLPLSGFGHCVLEIMIITSYHLIHVVLFLPH
jgi:hypothetical protein